MWVTPKNRPLESILPAHPKSPETCRKGKCVSTSVDQSKDLLYGNRLSLEWQTKKKQVRCHFSWW